MEALAVLNIIYRLRSGWWKERMEICTNTIG
jgi:hypothetical protein